MGSAKSWLLTFLFALVHFGDTENCGDAWWTPGWQLEGITLSMWCRWGQKRGRDAELTRGQVPSGFFSGSRVSSKPQIMLCGQPWLGREEVSRHFCILLDIVWLCGHRWPMAPLPVWLVFSQQQQPPREFCETSARASDLAPNLWFKRKQMELPKVTESLRRYPCCLSLRTQRKNCLVFYPIEIVKMLTWALRGWGRRITCSKTAWTARWNPV